MMKLLLWYSHTHLGSDCILQSQEIQIRSLWVTYMTHISHRYSSRVESWEWMEMLMKGSENHSTILIKYNFYYYICLFKA